MKLGRKKLESNKGLCKNGCKSPIHCRGVCRKCYRKIHYEEHEQARRYPDGLSKERECSKGSVRSNSLGYLAVKVEKGRGVGKRGEWMLHHRYVMENHLGRRLHSFENVHHINGNREDNRLENLELWVTKQPKGQRVDDLLAYADWIIKMYGNEDKIQK